VKSDQSNVLLRQHLHLVGDALVELVFLKRHIAVAELTFDSCREGSRILHHDLFGLGGGDRAREGQGQLGANLEPVHGTGARHALQGLYISFFE